MAGCIEELALELDLEGWVESEYLEGFLTAGTSGTKERKYRTVTENCEHE